MKFLTAEEVAIELRRKKERGSYNADRWLPIVKQVATIAPGEGLLVSQEDLDGRSPRNLIRAIRYRLPDQSFVEQAHVDGGYLIVRTA